MTHKLTTNGAAVVAPSVKWLKINEHTPVGARMQLIERAQGVAYTRIHHKADGFTHWFPLPTFDENEE